MLMKRHSWYFRSIWFIVSFCPTEMAKLYPMFTILRALLSAASKHRDSSSLRAPLLRSCLIPAVFAPLEPSLSASRRLLIAQGLGFGNYVVRRRGVLSANNVNGTAPGLSLRGCFILIAETHRCEGIKKQPGKQLSIQRTLSPHLQSGNCGKIKKLYFSPCLK